VGNNSFCSADTQLWTQVIPDQEQYSGFLRGSLALGANNTLALEYFYSQNTVTSMIAPAPEGGLTMRNNNPYYPGNGITPITNPALNPANPISVGWRTTVLGPRQTEIQNDTQRAVLSLDGNAMNWDYSANLLWSNAKVQSQFLQGYGNRSALNNGMSGANGAPFLNPFGPQSAAGQAYMFANTVTGVIQDIDGTLWSLNGVASTSFGKLDGGPMALALAAEYRSEDNTFKTDTAKSSQTTSSGLAGAAPLREGDRNVWAVALEMNFPVLKTLDIGFSIRYDDYSDFGGTTNPKIQARWQPFQQLLVRGSYNTGFAAPTLAQLYAPNSTTFTGGRYNDPVLCPNGVPNVAAGAVQSRDCGIQFQQLQGGNEQLQPEESDAWTIGFILQPTPEFSFGLDYWDYKVTSNLGVLNSCAAGGSKDPVNDPAKPYAFWIPDPGNGKTIRQVQLFFSSTGNAKEPTPYEIELSYQRATFDPNVSLPVVTRATVMLRGNNSENKMATFTLAQPIVGANGPSARAVAMRLRVLTNPDNTTITFNTGPCPPGKSCKVPAGCNATQVIPDVLPLGTLYRKSVGITVRGG